MGCNVIQFDVIGCNVMRVWGVAMLIWFCGYGVLHQMVRSHCPLDVLQHTMRSCDTNLNLQIIRTFNSWRAMVYSDNDFGGLDVTTPHSPFWLRDSSYGCSHVLFEILENCRSKIALLYCYRISDTLHLWTFDIESLPLGCSTRLPSIRSLDGEWICINRSLDGRWNAL